MGNLISFELNPRRRLGETWPEGTTRRTYRDFLDFVVGGHSLYDVLVLAKGYDLISGLWLDPQFSKSSKEAASRLLLSQPADFPGERRSLFICPECRDLGCGAISIIVHRDVDSVTWTGFGYENNYEECVVTQGFEGTGPFVFKRAQYEDALRDHYF